MQIQMGISAGHEDLLLLSETLDISTQPGGSSFHRSGTVTNRSAEYS